MTTYGPLPDEDPRMIAWTDYVLTEDYRAARKGARRGDAVDGSLWAAFETGWRSALAAAESSEPVGYAGTLGDMLGKHATPSPADRGAVEALIRNAASPVIDELAERFAEKPGNVDDYADYMGRIPDAIIAALALPAADGVKVKPLEWEAAGGDGTMSFRATAIGLRYYAYKSAEDGVWHSYTEGYKPASFGEFSTLEGAKAAAQADYAARILSALAAPSQAREGGGK